MKNYLIVLILLISKTVFSMENSNYIRLKEWYSAKGEPASSREQALRRTYSQIEVCDYQKGCIGTLWGENKNQGLIHENSSLILKIDSIRIHIADLGELISSGGGHGEPLYASFELKNPSVDLVFEGKAKLKYHCGIELNDLGFPSFQCSMIYQNKLKVFMTLINSGDRYLIYGKGQRSSGLKSGFTPHQVDTFIDRIEFD